tara:strand:- start:334 stop:570 length:237 start_codon:yes stop_codon:yes gene_type:complete
MGRSKPVTTSDIEEALDIAARVVDQFGYKYWPIFERLEAELESRASREKRLQSRLDRLCHDASMGIELRPPQESRENS